MKKYLLTTISAVALITTTFSAENLCFWFMYQEKLPQSAEKLRKIK